MSAIVGDPVCKRVTHRCASCCRFSGHRQPCTAKLIGPGLRPTPSPGQPPGKPGTDPSRRPKAPIVPASSLPRSREPRPEPRVAVEARMTAASAFVCRAVSSWRAHWREVVGKCRGSGHHYLESARIRLGNGSAPPLSHGVGGHLPLGVLAPQFSWTTSRPSDRSGSWRRTIPSQRGRSPHSAPRTGRSAAIWSRLMDSPRVRRSVVMGIADRTLRTSDQGGRAGPGGGRNRGTTTATTISVFADLEWDGGESSQCRKGKHQSHARAVRVRRSPRLCWPSPEAQAPIRTP